MCSFRPASPIKRQKSEEFFEMDDVEPKKARAASPKTTGLVDSPIKLGARPIQIPDPADSGTRSWIPKHPSTGYTMEYFDKLYGTSYSSAQPPSSWNDYELRDPLAKPQGPKPQRDKEENLLLGVGDIFAGSEPKRRGSTKAKATTMESSLSPLGSSSNQPIRSLPRLNSTRGRRRISKEELEVVLGKAGTTSEKLTGDSETRSETKNIRLRTLSSPAGLRQHGSGDNSGEKPDSRDDTGSNEGETNPREEGDKSDEGDKQDKPPAPAGGGGSDPPDDKDKQPPKDKGKDRAKESDDDAIEPEHDKDKPGPSGDKDKGETEQPDDDDEITPVHDKDNPGPPEDKGKGKAAAEEEEEEPLSESDIYRPPSDKLNNLPPAEMREMPPRLEGNPYFPQPIVNPANVHRHVRPPKVAPEPNPEYAPPPPEPRLRAAWNEIRRRQRHVVARVLHGPAPGDGLMRDPPSKMPPKRQKPKVKKDKKDDEPPQPPPPPPPPGGS